MRKLALLAFSAWILQGCGSATTKVYPNSGYLLPNQSIQLSPSTAISVETAILTGSVLTAIYLIYDPLAPNWEISERALNSDSYELSLRAKSFRVGGDGEAYQILKRRAIALQRVHGYSAYRILDYSEGIESSTPLTHRVGGGIIQLVRTDPLPPR